MFQKILNRTTGDTISSWIRNYFDGIITTYNYSISKEDKDLSMNEVASDHISLRNKQATKADGVHSVTVRRAFSCRLDVKMSVTTFLHHFIVSNLLTLYYNVVVLVIFAINYLKNPFGDPWALKLRLEPPTLLSDPKYGVHKYIKVNVSILIY